MVVVLVGGEGVGEGAVVVVEIPGSSDGEEGGDGGSSGASVGVAVTAYKQKNSKILLTVLLYITYLYS